MTMPGGRAAVMFSGLVIYAKAPALLGSGRGVIGGTLAYDSRPLGEGCVSSSLSKSANIAL